MLNSGLCPGCFSHLQLMTPLVLVSVTAANTCLRFTASVSVSQTVASPPATISSACLSFEVSPLSFPSVQLWSPRWSRLFICHICHVVSRLHATLNKQTICPIMPSLRALFFTSCLSTICHLLLNLSQPLSHLIIPSRLRSASVPVPPSSPPARCLPLSCHTWKDSVSLLCLL